MRIAGGQRFVGYGFAVPINLARRTVRDLVEYGLVRRPRLGVSVSDVTAVDAEAYQLDRVAGAEINSVAEGSPAARAKLQPGDVVIALDGRAVETANQLTTALAQRKPGERMSLTVMRRGRKIEVPVQLGEFERRAREAGAAAPALGPAARLGFEAATLTASLARQLDLRETQGVVVTGVMPGTAAAAGIRRGQIFRAINDREVRELADVDRIAAHLRPGQVASLRVRDPEVGETIVNYRLAGS